MRKIKLNCKSLFVGLAIAGACTSAAAIGQLCDKGGYIKRVTQGWPHDNNVIGISIKDEQGNETFWTTAGAGDVNGHAWVRALHAMALTAYANQYYVFPTVAYGNCTANLRAMDSNYWHSRWEGLVIAAAPGRY